MFTSKNISVNINNNSSLYLLGFPFVVLFNSNENHFIIHFDAIKKLCGYKKCRGDIDQEHFINTYRRYIYIYMGHVRYALLVFLFRFFSPLSSVYIRVFYRKRSRTRREERPTTTATAADKQFGWMRHSRAYYLHLDLSRQNQSSQSEISRQQASGCVLLFTIQIHIWLPFIAN